MYPLIEPPELAALIESGKDNLKIIDATCAATIPRLSPFQAFQLKHIAQACYFDIDDIADQQAELPHTIPDAHFFAEKVTDLGAHNNQHIVIYDQTGIAFAAARAWWMFRLFGHDNVQILNGGLPAWETEGYATTQDVTETKTSATPFKSTLRPHLLKYMDDVLKETNDDQCLILDARAPDRFSGAIKESRDFVGNGHIPSSKNQFFMELIDKSTGKMKSKKELEDILLPYISHTSITCSCGGGVTACILALGLFIVGYENASIYDGSWAEWGNKSNNMPIKASA